MQIREWLGRAASVAVAPMTFAASAAARLSGPAFVRLSSALFHAERPDLLGVAVTLRGDAPIQDMLFATTRSLFTLPLAVFTTNVHDFLDNDYWAITPFELDGVGRVHLRLVPRPHPKPRRERGHLVDRETLVDEAAARGSAGFDLEIRPRGGAWTPLLAIRLGEEIELPEGSLRMTPFHDGRGLHPVGFVNALRRFTYAASVGGRTRFAP